MLRSQLNSRSREFEKGRVLASAATLQTILFIISEMLVDIGAETVVLGFEFISMKLGRVGRCWRI